MDAIIQKINDSHRDYLGDESRRQGQAHWIAFPRNKSELGYVLKWTRARKIPITIQGSRTNMMGLAVPHGGCIINLSQNKEIIEIEGQKPIIHVSAGVTLTEIYNKLRGISQGGQSLFLPLNPTEGSATIGGVAATNAFGLLSEHYGDASEQIERVEILTQSGEIRCLTGTQLARGLHTGEIITEVWLRLVPLPEERWGILFLFEGRVSAVDFMESAEQKKVGKSAHITAMEYMDREAICYGKQMQQQQEKRPLLKPEQNPGALVYLELHGRVSGVETLAEELLEVFESQGGGENDALAFTGANEIEQVYAFRHGLVEGINAALSQGKRVKNLWHWRNQNHSIRQIMEACDRFLEERKQQGILYGHPRNLYVEIID
ncbi:FAD-binding oxidoreductase [Eubacterium sp.]|uniref:FAD-binding oxidoreductase n=1 Tax=Eubacterium sp. TaxID=142586 RepID=UPI002FC738E5